MLYVRKSGWVFCPIKVKTICAIGVELSVVDTMYIRQPPHFSLDAIDCNESTTRPHHYSVVSNPRMLTAP
jgi:hypothetical protein